MNNIEKLTERLNACKNRRRIYNALMAISSEPSVEQIKDAAEKQNVLFAQVVGFITEAECA